MTTRDSSHALLEFEVTQILKEASDLEAAAPQLLRALGTGLGCDVCEFWLLDLDADLLRRIGCWYAADLDVTRFEWISRGMSVPRGYGVPGRVLATGSIEWTADLRIDPGVVRKQASVDAGLRSVLGFPITDNREVTGAVVLLARDSSEPDERLKSTLGALGQRIGEFARTEQSLQRSPAYFRAIIENQCDIVTLIGLDGVIHYENAAITQVLGYDRHERIGKSVYDFIHPEDIQRGLDAYRAGLDQPGSTQVVRIRARHKDGSWRQLESTGRVMVDRSGNYVAVLNTRDISDRTMESPRPARGGIVMTDRQARILTMVAEGMTNRRIAEELCVSPHTVKDNLQAAMRKLKARNRAQAVLAAAKAGLI